MALSRRIKDYKRLTRRSLSPCSRWLIGPHDPYRPPNRGTLCTRKTALFRRRGNSRPHSQVCRRRSTRILSALFRHYGMPVPRHLPLGRHITIKDVRQASVRHFPHFLYSASSTIAFLMPVSAQAKALETSPRSFPSFRRKKPVSPPKGMARKRGRIDLRARKNTFLFLGIPSGDRTPGRRDPSPRPLLWPRHDVK